MFNSAAFVANRRSPRTTVEFSWLTLPDRMLPDELPLLASTDGVAPDVVRKLDQMHADRSDFRAIGRVIAPWGRRIGDQRFESEGAWKRTGTTVDTLSRELKLALEYPEGAA